MKLTIEQLIQTAHAELLVSPRDASAVLSSLEWDSRLVKPGSLFVAIVGEKANGNAYIEAAIEAGAAAVIASEDPPEAARALAAERGSALLQARDNNVLRALQELAGAWRRTLPGTVVGVTGSSGKTTTKDLIAGVLSGTFNTHATAGNRNSEIGLSETLLDATADHEVIVVEMGMQALGEIRMLSKAAAPRVGVITNIGVAHCELLGSRENIARAKAELLESLPDASGIAVLPGDDPYVTFLREVAELNERMVKTVTYGLGSQNDIRATDITYDAMGYPSFNIWTPDGRSHQAQLSLQGEHNVLNALAAVAVGLELGVSISVIINALAKVQPAALRQEIVKTSLGDIILNDTYNANPDSMRAALSLLKRLATSGKRVAVLGDMYELGSEEVDFHRQIGEYAFLNRVDELVTVGALGAEIAHGALAVGMPAERVHVCTSAEEALEALERLRLAAEYEQTQLVVLVKASRGMQLERIVEGLIERAEDKAGSDAGKVPQDAASGASDRRAAQPNT